MRDAATATLITSGTNLFAATNVGVYRSTDNGMYWTSVSGGSCYALLASGSNIFRGSGSGVLLSTDNGDTWTWVNNGLTSTNVRCFAVNDTNLFVGVYGGGVFHSTNNGSSWTAASSGMTNLDMNALAVSGQNLFAGTAGGVFLSTNNGTSWTAANTGLTQLFVQDLAVSGASILAGTLSYGVFLSTNNGTSWTGVNRDLTSLRTSALLVDGAKLYAGVRAGGVWSASINSLIPPSAPADLAITDSSSGTLTIKWRKNTESDFLRYRIYRGLSPNPTSKVDSTTGGAGDTSRTFTGLTNGVQFYFRVTAVDSTGTESGYSNEVNAVPADRLIPAIPQNLVVADSSSTTITIKWRKNADSDFLRYRIYRGTSANPTTKVDSTTAGAADTTKTFTGLVNGTRYYLRVTAVDSTGNESAYSNEVNAAPNVPSGIDDLLSQIPTDFSLAQNYPNPFNPATVIRYGLPVQSHVRLEVYDILGQRVALLADEEQDARYYELTWEAGGASGLYFYRLEATASADGGKRYVEVRKMLFMK